MREPKKRYHIDNAFMQSPRVFRLFQLYQLCDLACSDDYEVRDHKQFCHEISYIVSGEGVFARNGVSYQVTPGMLFLVSKSDIHYIRSSKSNPLRYVCMAFTFNQSANDFCQYAPVEDFFNNLVNPVAIDIYNIYEPFVMALSEMSNPNPLSEELLASYLCQIIIFTYRSFQRQHLKHYFSTLSVDNTPMFVYEIISYIDTNLTNIRHLTELGDRLGYSYVHLSKTFSKAMGMTIQAYYTKRRFDKAAELLKDNEDISFVSDKLGFANVQSFCKAFKKYYNVPPGQFRKTQQTQPLDSRSADLAE